MNRLAYAAVNLGERELQFGFDPAQQKFGRSTFPLVSANFVYQDSGEPITQPSIVRTLEVGPPGGKKSKFRVGILGLVRLNSGLAQLSPAGRRMVTADPIASARKILPALRKKSDYVVALVTLDPEQARSLAKEVPGIDLILGGFGPAQTGTGDTEGETQIGPTRILYSGNQGKRIGETRIFLTEEGKVERLQRDVVSLTKAVPDDPDLMALVEKNRLAINELNRKEAPLVDMEKIRATYQGVAYVKVDACKDCHEREHRIWEETKHAHAFQTLVQKHQDYNPDCVGCHTTGYRRPTGFLNARSTPDLMNVQCEACHGPGRDHPEKVGKEYGKVGAGWCVTCHTTENSPDFDAVGYMFKIRHWGPDDAPAAPSPSTH